MKLSGYILGLLALCMQPSCDSDSRFLSGETEPGGEIEPAFVSHMKQLADEPEKLLPQGTVAGLYAAPYGQSPAASAPDHSNIRCVCGLAGNLDPAGNLQLKEGEDYSFYAYAPYKTGTPLQPEAIPFRHGEDVLLCTGNPSLRNVGSDNRSVSLRFLHLTAQIRFIVKISEETAGTIQPTTVLHVSGFLPEATLDLVTGRLTASGESSGLTDLKVAATADETGLYSLASDPVCFFTTPDTPHSIRLRVTHEGITHTGDITAAFVPGESSVYTIWIGSQVGLNLTAAITDWVNLYESIDIH